MNLLKRMAQIRPVRWLGNLGFLANLGFSAQIHTSDADYAPKLFGSNTPNDDTESRFRIR